MKRYVGLFFLMFFCISLLVPVIAEAEENPVPYYTVIDALSADISIDEQTGKTTCTGSILAKSGTAVSITVELHKLVNNRWEIIETWENSRTTYVACTGKTSVEPGFRYRTYVVGYTMDDNGRITESGHTSKAQYYG